MKNNIMFSMCKHKLDLTFASIFEEVI